MSISSCKFESCPGHQVTAFEFFRRGFLCSVRNFLHPHRPLFQDFSVTLSYEEADSIDFRAVTVVGGGAILSLQGAFDLLGRCAIYV